MPETTTVTEPVEDLGLTAEDLAVLEAADNPKSAASPAAPAAPVVLPESEKFSGVDPDKLPEELKPVYASFQADYTRKTQALAAQRKEVEAKLAASVSDRKTDRLEAELAALRDQIATRQEAPRAKPPLPEDAEPWERTLRHQEEVLEQERTARQSLDRRVAVREAETVFERMLENKYLAPYQKEVEDALKVNSQLRESVVQDPKGAFDRIFGHFLQRDLPNLIKAEREAERKQLLETARSNAQKATKSRTSLDGAAAKTRDTGPMSLEDSLAAAVASDSERPQGW